jgi:membrane-associated phospholipid phosphatase
VTEQAVGTNARAAWRALAITVGATLLTLLADRWVYQNVQNPSVYDRDWGRLLRVMGFAGTWVALAAFVRLQGGASVARRAWLVFWSPVVAGAVAELLKLVVRRERPALHDGLYGFRPFDERTWNAAGLAFPSSHAAVAFGGAAMLARLYPRARWVGYTLAAGCAYTRLFAAGLGWLVAWLLVRRWPVDAS